jgi:hypothetical protein
MNTSLVKQVVQRSDGIKGEKLAITKNEDFGYFICIKGVEFSSDYVVSQLYLNIDYGRYRRELLNQFNGELIKGEVFFEDRNDANQAIEWMKFYRKLMFFGQLKIGDSFLIDVEDKVKVFEKHKIEGDIIAVDMKATLSEPGNQVHGYSNYSI